MERAIDSKGKGFGGTVTHPCVKFSRVYPSVWEKEGVKQILTHLELREDGLMLKKAAFD